MSRGALTCRSTLHAIRVNTSMALLLIFSLLAAVVYTVAGAQQQATIVNSTSGQRFGSALQDACVQDPTQPGCVSYKYPQPYAYEDLDSLCTAMPFMPSCSVYTACNATKGKASHNLAVCRPFNLLATVCLLDAKMSGMSGCATYNKLCNTNGTVVRDCIELGGMLNLPTADATNSLVRNICSEMDMDGCEKCTPSWQAGKKYAECDLVGVYSDLCYQMPDMWECAPYKRMCISDPTLFLCGDDSQGTFKHGPAMLMYFNSQLPFYLLFKQWTPRTTVQYFWSWLAIFGLAVLYEALQTARSRLEMYWKDIEGVPYTRLDSDSPPKLIPRGLPSAWFPCFQDLIRAGFTFVTVAISYLCMLAAMSFNLGILFAVCAGFAMGELAFRRIRVRNDVPQHENPCCPSGPSP